VRGRADANLIDRVVNPSQNNVVALKRLKTKLLLGWIIGASEGPGL